MKRVFIAIKASSDIQKKSEIWKNKYPELPVRWLSNNNLHITLVPPWEENNIEIIIGKLEKIPQKLSPFEVNYTKIAFGPTAKEPRLIWAEGNAPKELIKLKNETFETLGVQKPVRKFKLHLTLARFREENFCRFPINVLNEKINWKETVDSVSILESILRPEGAEYIVLKTFKLNS